MDKSEKKRLKKIRDKCNKNIFDTRDILWLLDLVEFKEKEIVAIGSTFDAMMKDWERLKKKK